MATMNISLPDPMKSWVEARTKTGRFANSSDYVRDLIRRDVERQEKIARMRDLVNEARASGISELSLDEIFELSRAKAQR